MKVGVDALPGSRFFATSLTTIQLPPALCTSTICCFKLGCDIVPISRACLEEYANTQTKTSSTHTCCIIMTRCELMAEFTNKIVEDRIDHTATHLRYTPAGLQAARTPCRKSMPIPIRLRLFMTAPKPLLTYQEFVDYDISLPVARAVCLKAGTPEPTSIRRLKRGEVNAIFLLELPGGDLLVLKVWVRCSDDEVMRREEGVVSIAQRESTVPTPPWIYVSSGDALVPYPHALIEYVGGVDVDRVWSELNIEDKEKILVQCACHLRALHSIPLGPHAAAILGNPISGNEWRKSQENRFQRAIGLLRKQGWLGKDTLDRCIALWTDQADSMETAEVDALVHHDFQLHNLRVDPETLNLVAVLDFGKAKIAPAFTDSRDLYLSVFLTTPEISGCFWRAYGMLSAEQELVLRLHSLARVLDILAAYQGPAPAGWDRTTVLKLLE